MINLWRVGLMTLAVLMMSLTTALAQKGKKAARESSAPTTRAKDYKYAPSAAPETLLNDADEIQFEDPVAALERVKEALAISITRKDVYNEGKCYILLGDINFNMQEFKLSLDNYTTGEERLRNKYDDTREYLLALRGMANANLKLGNYDEAIQLLNQVTSRRRLEAKMLAESQLDLSEVYYQKGDFEQALNTINKIDYNPKVADPVLSLRVENQKAKIYAQTNQLEKASQSLQSSQQIQRSNAGAISRREAAEIESAKEDVSDVLEEQARYDDQIALRNSSIESNLASKNLAEVSKDKVELSKALVAKGETSAAIRELEEAAQIADTINDPRKQANAYLSLAGIYEDRGDEPKALRTYRKYSEATARAEQQTEQKQLEKSELINQQRDIAELSKYLALAQEQEAAMLGRQRLIIYGLLLIILIIAVTSYFIYKNAQASKVANQMLALKSLRSQMNPHFIFNALNSLNHFVAESDERSANKFLAEFSRLMRLVLENSQQDFIPLYKEEEIIALYLKLEHYRFREKFDYEIHIDESINKEAVHIPPMLIQPYIENAVWHGLRYRDTKGFLSVNIRDGGSGLTVEITDNGIGRKKSHALKTENQKKHQSTGLKNIRERLGIINKLYHVQYTADIADLPSDSGTKVTLQIPTNHKVLTHA